MARMIPPIIDDTIKSNAERRLFNWLETLNWKNSVVLHSLGLADHQHNIFGEVDFVIVCTEGILCIEVKGGTVSRKNGIWYFQNRYGKSDSSNKGPFEQVQGNMHSLRSVLKKRLAENDPINKCQFASCIFMPDCCIVRDGVDVIPEILFDGNNNKDELRSFLEDSFTYWKGQCLTKHGFIGGQLSITDINKVVEMLRGDFKIVPSMSIQVNRIEEDLLQLTEEQFEIMKGFDDNDRLLISGSAGTGKTLLAIEQCRRLSASGKKVLYLCFNHMLCSYVKYYKDSTEGNFDVFSFHQLLLEQTNYFEIPLNRKKFFEEELPLQFLENAIEQHLTKKYECIIIDEGQDLMNSMYCKCIDKMLIGGLENGIWTFYYDSQQNIFNQNIEFDTIYRQLKILADSNFKLSINCRNSKQIAIANKLVSNIKQAEILKTKGIEVEYIKFDSKQKEIHEIVSVIRKLKAHGISSDDIVVLSPYQEKSCLNGYVFPKDIGSVRMFPKSINNRDGKIDICSIQTYKGLESKVVILIDVDEFVNNQARLLNYVAISRAKSMLYIIYDAECEDDRQSMLLTGALMK